MKDKDKNISHLVPTVLIVALALFGFSLYQSDQAREEVLLNSFSDGRLELVRQGLQGLRKNIETEHFELFVDCSERGQYNAYIDTDSRTMSATELKDALRLHDECGQLFSNKTNLTLAFYKIEIDRLKENASLLKDGKEKNDALQVVSFWEELYALELEHGTIYRRMIDIQEEYWTADLNKASFIETGEEREAKVGALNFEANGNLERLGVIQSEIERFRVAEASYWNDYFATSTKVEN